MGHRFVSTYISKVLSCLSEFLSHHFSLLDNTVDGNTSPSSHVSRAFRFVTACKRVLYTSQSIAGTLRCRALGEEPGSPGDVPCTHSLIPLFCLSPGCWTLRASIYLFWVEFLTELPKAAVIKPTLRTETIRSVCGVTYVKLMNLFERQL